MHLPFGRQQGEITFEADRSRPRTIQPELHGVQGLVHLPGDRALIDKQLLRSCLTCIQPEVEIQRGQLLQAEHNPLFVRCIIESSSSGLA